MHFIVIYIKNMSIYILSLLNYPITYPIKILYPLKLLYKNYGRILNFYSVVFGSD